MRQFEITRDKIKLTGLDSKHITLIVWLLFVLALLAGITLSIWMMQPSGANTTSETLQASADALDARPIWALGPTVWGLVGVYAIARVFVPCSSWRR